MLFPIIVFGVWVALLVFAFGVAWAGWLGGDTGIAPGYWWLFLIAMLISIASIIRWGAGSNSYRNRNRWVAFILGAVLVMGLGVWWIVSLGVLIFPVGLILFIVSTVRLGLTFRSSRGVPRSTP
jgi:hypothetical protein